MFGQMGLHIIKFPTGRYGYVGSIPVSLGAEVKATQNDIMGGRAFKNEEGELVTIKFPSFETREKAIVHAGKWEVK